jgi:hypothetical protein
VWHRTYAVFGGGFDLPLGLVLGWLALAGLAVAGRAVAGWVGLVGVAVGVFMGAQAVTWKGPGGDLLVQGDLTGAAWALGAPVITLVAAFLPARWFNSSRAD